MSGRRFRGRHNSKIAVAYCRASTGDQKLSPEVQRAAISDWARAEGINVVSWHVDAAVSGGADLSTRPALIEAIGAVRAQKAGVLIVARRDRLARDVAIAAMIERAVEAAGARISSADGVGNGDTAADSFLRSILDAASAYERRLLQLRTKSALAAKRARGERAGTVPFGYTADAEGRLLASPEEQLIIARVRELRSAGLSIRKIVRAAVAEGFVTRRGLPLTKTSVERILAKAA